MTARAEQRVHHRRRVTTKRAVIASTAALDITGAALVTTTMLSSADGVHCLGSCTLQMNSIVGINSHYVQV